MKNSKLDIRALRVRPVCVPMRLPLQTATGIVDIAPLVLLDLETTAGITGRSYLFAVNRLFLKPLVALCETMGEMVKGDPVAPFDLEKKLRQKHTLLGVHNIVLFAMAGIDMAAWDAYAQSLGQPLVKVLGGTPRPIKAYNSKGLGIMPLKPLAKEAEALVKEGFSAVKLRLGRADAKDDRGAERGRDDSRRDARGGRSRSRSRSPRGGREKAASERRSRVSRSRSRSPRDKAGAKRSRVSRSRSRSPRGGREKAASRDDRRR